jgi:predicted ATPase
MRITFQIHELGRLKDTSFDLHPFLIFTGDSNLGKSYCAFLVYGFLKSLETELFINFIGKILNIKAIVEKLKTEDELEIEFDLKYLEVFFNENAQSILGSLIGYEEVKCKVSLQIENIKARPIVISKTANIFTVKVDEFGSAIIYMPSTLNLYDNILRKVAHLSFVCIKNILSKNFQTSFIFPPARGSILSFPYTMQKAVSSNMRMYSEFLTDMDKLREPSFGKKEINTEVLTKLKEIMEGEIKVRQNEIQYHFGNQSIPITAAASSIKELAPLFLLLKKEEIKNISLLFEEPESHLHPSMQKKLADLLAYMVNEGAFLQITTHSDYMLSEWNNLLRLYFIKQKSEAAFQEVISETGMIADCALIPEKVGAYYFKEREDGSVELIKSEITENEQIRFTSFKDTVNVMNENRYILKEKLSELNEEA